MSIGEDFAASLQASQQSNDVQQARAARVQYLGGLTLAGIEREEEKERAADTYDEKTQGLYRALKADKAAAEVERLKGLGQPELILTEYIRGVRDGIYTEKFRPVVQQLWTDTYKTLAQRSAGEKAVAAGGALASAAVEAVPMLVGGMIEAGKVATSMKPEDVARGAAAAELGGAQSMRLLRGIGRLAEEDTTEEGLAKIFERDEKELSAIEGARRYEGKFLNDMAAKAPGLKAAVEQIKLNLTPEELERVDELSNIFDPTELIPIGFVVGKVGRLFGAVAKTPGGRKVMARTFKTAAEAAEEAEKLNSTFNKVRKSVGEAMQRQGQRIATTPGGAPISTFVGGMAAGLEPSTAFVAAAVASNIPRQLRGAVGGTIESAGRVIAKDLPVPLERARRGAVEASKELATGAAEGAAGNAIFALGAETPEQAGGLIGTGVGLGGGVVATGQTLNAGKGLLDVTGNRFSPADRTAQPSTRTQSSNYGDGLDDIHAAAVGKLDNASANAIEEMRQTLVGPKGRLYVVDTPEQAAKIASFYTGKEVTPEQVTSNGFSYQPEQTKQGVGVAVVFSQGEAFGHEPGHLIYQAMRASEDPAIKQLAADVEKAARQSLPEGSKRFNELRDYYNSLLPEGAAKIDGDQVIEEFITEHFTTVVGGAPAIKFGGDMPLSKKIYDAALTLAEKAGIYQAGLDLSGRSPVSSATLPIKPSPQLARLVDNMLAARQLELSKSIPSDLVNQPPVVEQPAGVQNVEVVVPPAQPPGFKKGDPIGNITDPQGNLVFTGAKIWADAQGPTVRIEGVDQQGNIVRADVPRAWLESGRATATPPVDVGTLVPVPAEQTGRPATVPQAPQPAAPAPQAPKPAVANVTEQQRTTVAGTATPELQAQNEKVLAENLNRPVEVEYLSALASDQSGKASVRLRERQLADRNEQEGVPNPFRAAYGKVVIPTSIRTPGTGKRVIFGFSPDKLIRNIDQLRGWYLERGDKAAADRLYSPEFQQQVRTYLENQSNGYRGDGQRISRPADTDPALYPPENPAYTPVPVPEADRNLINFLMGLDAVSPTSLSGKWVMKLAELNGFKPASYVAGAAGKQKPVYNPLTQQLRDAGFDGSLNSAIEQLRVERMTSPAVPRPDLASIKPAVQGSVQAGFMPAGSPQRGDIFYLRDGTEVEFLRSIPEARGGANDGAARVSVRTKPGFELKYVLADELTPFPPGVDPDSPAPKPPAANVRELLHDLESEIRKRRQALEDDFGSDFMPEAAKPEGRRELVNVGLKIGDKVALTEQDVIKAFADEGITLENVQVRESGTEPTVIAAVSAANEPAIRRISEKLGQDAIAVYNPADDSGYLAGPRPENFGGKFLKEYFLMPESEQAFMPAPPVESEAFKKWFGDWQDPKAFTSKAKGPVSMVVENGRPRVVYHGTAKNFTAFKPSGEGVVSMGILGSFPVERTGIFFAEDAEVGSSFADRDGGNVIPAYLDIKSPADLTTPDSTFDVLEEIGLNGRRALQGGFQTWELFDGGGGRETVAKLKEAGYDGALLEEYIPDLEKSATVWVAFDPAQVKSATGNVGTFDPKNPDIRYMPKAKKPRKGSLGKGSIKFFHYSDTPNKGIIDPKFFGRSGVTGAREQAGLPRAYAYAEGSLLGQDAGLIDARAHYYEGTASKGQIYDGVEDTLGYGDMANRAKADQMLVDKGFIGIYREGLNGVKQLEFFQPMEVQEAEKPDTTGPLAEEAMPLLPPLALEEIDYAAQDREFARKKAAGEPLYMPEGDEMREYSVEFKVQHPSWSTPKGWNKHETVMARSRRDAINSVKQQIYDNQFGQGMVWIRATETTPDIVPARSKKAEAANKFGFGAFGIFTKQVDGKTVYYSSPNFKDVEGTPQELARIKYGDNIPPELQELIDETNKASEGAFMPKARGITSQIEATLQAIPEKASRQQIEAALRDGVKQKGQLVERPVKAEEMRDIVDQTGRSFEDFLKENPQATRDEMLDFVRQNQIQVTEERLGRFGKAAEHTEAEWTRMSEEWEEAGKRAQERGDTEAANRFFARSEQAARYAEGLDDAGSTGGSPKFERYTLPGGQRYREIIYTTPEQGPSFTRDDLEHVTEGVSPREQALFWVIKGPDNTYIISKKEYKTLDAAMEHVVRTKQPHSTGYKSPHFEDVPNYLAHARVNERSTTEGESMLFAEEIQSDLHQKARTEGYREPLTPDEESALLEQQMALNREYAAAVKADNVPEMERLEAEKQALRNRFKRAKSGIPDAPFKKSWHEFVFKNLLRDAMEQGKDWLGWTTGDQQAARYDLSKQIAKVQVMPSRQAGRERLWAYDHAGKMVLNQQIDAGTADQYVGKEVAKKLYEAPELTFRDAVLDEDKTYREVSGIDLKVGGEGMKGFYDEILPRFVDKYLKKYGIKTETINVPANLDSATWKKFAAGDKPLVLDDTVSVHAIRITPELRKDVLEKGQPAYMPAAVKPFTPDAAAAFMPVPRVDLEDYIGRDVVTLTTDRLDIGTKDVGPVGARKPLAKEAQGGRGFPHLYTGLGWAFSDPASASRFLTRLKATAEGDTALVATSVLAEPNVLNSPFGQHAVAAAFRHAVEAGALKEKDVDKSIKLIFSRAAKSAGGDKAFARIKSLADYEREAADWPFSFGATREAVQRLDAAELKIPAEVRQELGLDLLTLARSISDPELAGLPTFSLVSLMEIPVDQKPVKDDIHHSYPYTVKGRLLGFMKSPYRAESLISTPRVRNRQGALTAQPMMTVMPSLDILKPSEINPDPAARLAEARLDYAGPLADEAP